MTMTVPNDCQRGFCRTCYAEAIARLCAGYAIVKAGKPTAVVPPLRRDLALYVTWAARDQLAARGQGDTARHPGHMGDRR